MANISSRINLTLLKHARREMNGQGGKKIDCLIIPIDENHLYKGEKGVKIPLQAHPDLVSLYNQLREYVLREFYIESTSENLTLVDVTSVQIMDRKVLISANFNTLHGDVVNLNTSKIDLDGSESGIESEIDVIVDSIVDEVFQYLFKGKRADPTLFEEVEEKKTDEAVKFVKSGLNVSSHAAQC